jgi:hypothetical protein
MRQAINENPVVQVVLLGVLGIVVAFLFMTRVVSQDEGASSDAATPAPTAAGAPPVPSTPDPAAAVSDVSGVAPSTSAAPVSGVGFEAGPGLPESVVGAYEAGDVIALLVVNRKGTEDKRLEAEVEDRLRGRSDTSVFVVEAKDIARYSRIAEGVNLDRVPALVVVEPRRQVKGELPVATISYGFRGPESVEQTVLDVLYEGKQLPYHPG